jgi:DNA-binding XRE family transcriptional regulator
MSFGQRLRDQRRERDLSQLELADKAGYSINTIRKLESDERRPRASWRFVWQPSWSSPSASAPTFRVSHAAPRWSA